MVVIGVGGGGATAAFSVVFVVVVGGGGGGGGLVAVVVIVIVDHMTGGLGSSIPGAISSHHGFLPLPQCLSHLSPSRQNPRPSPPP